MSDAANAKVASHIGVRCMSHKKRRVGGVVGGRPDAGKFDFRVEMKLRNCSFRACRPRLKTTLVGRLLQQSGAFRENSAGPERSWIRTISKERSRFMARRRVAWKGRADQYRRYARPSDFGGEVERIFVHGPMGRSFWWMPPKGRCRKPNRRRQGAENWPEANCRVNKVR